MNVLLISTYELGHQPFGLTSPAAWLRDAGANVTCLDLSRENLQEEPLRAADFIAFYLPMHTATRLAAGLIEPVRKINSRAHLCVYGLYAPVNADYFRSLGVQTIIGGEFEEALTQQLKHVILSEAKNLSENESSGTNVVLPRLNFKLPDRAGLPPLKNYAHLILPDGSYQITGYTEASRGCKHLCRHCPIVPVYNGAFRIVQRDIVLADIRQQIAAGAQHITFGDPDFFNGPAHATAIIKALHDEFPLLTYDATIKIEHLLRHADLLATLRDTGCLFVTSAVESVDDAILEHLDKGHTRADFLKVVQNFHDLGLVLQPTFLPFTPWTTLDGYRDLLIVIAENDLIEHVTPIQLGIRLLIPAGSRLLELKAFREMISEFDPAGLLYPWKHSDARVDALAQRIQSIADACEKARRSRNETFAQIWRAAADASGAAPNDPLWQMPQLKAAKPVPRISEPWYCCAEPTQDQFVAIGAVTSKPKIEIAATETAEGFL